MKVLDKLELANISTKTFFGIVKTLSLTKPLFIIDKKDEAWRSLRGISPTSRYSGWRDSMSTTSSATSSSS